MTKDRVDLVLRAHERRVGSGTVQRVLPQMQRRSVGPWVFLDHMGPEEIPAGHGFDVGPHPHIGLATVTYLFDGAVVHRDSLGSERTIVPGELNWMSAGRGIVHSERSPDDVRARGGRMHGLQLWVALPVAAEEGEPTFQHVAGVGLPAHTLEGGVCVRVLAGVAYGVRASVEVASPLFFVEARLREGERLAFPAEHEDRAVYVVDGAVDVEGARAEARTMVIVSEGDRCVVALDDAHVVMLGGERLPEPRHMRWNFVASTKERLDEAERAWREGRFPRIPTDDGVPIPMPERA